MSDGADVSLGSAFERKLKRSCGLDGIVAFLLGESGGVNGNRELIVKGGGSDLTAGDNDIMLTCRYAESGRNCFGCAACAGEGCFFNSVGIPYLNVKIAA